MIIISSGKGHIDIKHEGEIFRLSGDLSSDGFVAMLSTIQRFSPDKLTVSITEQEQLQIMHIVNKYWCDDKCPIYFIDDNYNIISDTKNRK